MNSDMDERGALNTVVNELRAMHASAEYKKGRMNRRVLAARADPDELLHHEWLLGRLSGIAEALAYVEGVVDGAGVGRRKAG